MLSNGIGIGLIGPRIPLLFGGVQSRSAASRELSRIQCQLSGSSHSQQFGDPLLPLVECQKDAGGKRPSRGQVPQVKRGVPFLPTMCLAEAANHVECFVFQQALSLEYLTVHRPVETIDDPARHRFGDRILPAMNRCAHRSGKQ